MEASILNSQRAKEIAASPVIANVTHDEIRIYIQHVDEKKQRLESIRLVSQPV
jgi:H-type small acid-soluble spore protein